MTIAERAYKRKLDLYYIALIFYVIAATIYIIVSGSFIGDKFEFVVRDPVVYVFGGVILYAIVLLLVNLVRNRRLVITSQCVVFKSRFGERRYYFAHIEKILLGRERRRVSDAIFNVVKLRIAMRRRWIRIRTANYEHEQELYAHFEALKKELKK